MNVRSAVLVYAALIKAPNSSGSNYWTRSTQMAGMLMLNVGHAGAGDYHLKRQAGH